MTFEKRSWHNFIGEFREKKDEVLRRKCIRSNRYTDWKLADKVEKLNVNKHLFYFKKTENLEYFWFLQLKFLRFLNILLLIEIWVLFGYNEYIFCVKGK